MHYALSDPDYIINILVSVKDILDEDAVKRFADIWSKLSPR